LCAGGKTASLKAVGLTAIMAKAGLFIPTAHQPPVNVPSSIHCQEHSNQQQQEQEAQHPDPQQSNQQQQQGSQHAEVQMSDKQQEQQQQESQKPGVRLSDKQQQQQQQPRVVFFDRVLADVGDSQNLQQSLSTFSGHIRRVRSILQEATPRSLVLLDEVGMPLLVSCLSVCLSASVLVLLLFYGSGWLISASCS